MMNYVMQHYDSIGGQIYDIEPCSYRKPVLRLTYEENMIFLSRLYLFEVI